MTEQYFGESADNDELRGRARYHVRNMSESELAQLGSRIAGYARPTREQRALADAIAERQSARARLWDLARAQTRDGGGMRGADENYLPPTPRAPGGADDPYGVAVRSASPYGSPELDAGRTLQRSPEVVVRNARLMLDADYQRGTLPARSCALLEAMLVRPEDSAPRIATAEYLAATGSPVYREAFARTMLDPQRAQFMLTDQQRAAMARAVNARSLFERALTIGTPAAFGPGSYPVPYQVDPTVTLTSSGAISEIREIARTEQIVGREWLGVTSTGVVVTRSLEAAVATDATASPFAMNQPGVAANRVSAFVPFSVETEQDWNGLLAEISTMIADAKDVEEAGSFLTGNGTAPNPQGVLTGISGSPQQVLTATTAVTAIADIYNVESQAAPRYRARSVWLASKPGYNAIRQLWTGQASSAGDVWVRPSQGTPPEFIGYPARENSNMSGATTTSGSIIAVFGDWKQLLLVDRVGMSLELIPHVFQQATAGTGFGMPTGQRGVWAMWRNSSIVLVPNAFRYLQVR
jgi:HK97 family phage major capsid protein